MECCSIGVLLQQDCHKTLYTAKIELIPLGSLCSADRELLLWRTALKDKAEQVTNLCMHHKEIFLAPRFEHRFKNCCDIYKSHKKKAKGSILITLEIAKKMEKLSICIKPGWRVCATCYKRFQTDYNCLGDSETSSNPSTSDSDSLNFSFDCDPKSQFHQDLAKETLNETFQSVGVSPVGPSHSLPKRQHILKAKDKVSKVAQKLENSFATVIGTEEENITIHGNTTITANEIKLLQKKANDQDLLMEHVKTKIAGASSYNEKLMLLTLKPQSWSIKQAAAYFGESEYLIKRAMKEKESDGILSKPTIPGRNKISDATKAAVSSMYENDEFTRLMPGIKDYVSVSKNVHKQKRLILCNLKELYATFCEKYPELKIGFSKFCSLRPKWCVPVSSKVSHSVCVCIQHQNAILLVDAANNNETYTTY